MKKITTISLSALAAAAVLALAACGGGGDGGSSTTPSNNNGGTPPTSGNSGDVTTPQYPSNSMQASAFALLNQQRQACGLPAVVENTLLDQAAQAHAQYLGTNAVISDTEINGNTGFTGATYADRAAHFGYANSVNNVTGVSAGYYTNATLTDEQYGQQLVYQWMSGVYHIAVASWPVTSIGIGMNKTAFNGYPQIQGSLSLANLKAAIGNGPLTFPCQGTTGVAYKAAGESPVPPNTAGAWGTPVAVVGNPTDTITLQSGTMTDNSGNVISLLLLNSASDPNKLLPKFEGVAYPATPLAPNTPYSVSINGTINGTAFSRNFTFTTGSIVG